MRLTTTCRVFFLISFLIAGLLGLYFALPTGAQERSLVPSAVPQETYPSRWSDYGWSYPECYNSQYPYSCGDRYGGCSEICYRWIPGHYKYYKRWVPGYWSYRPIWIPDYWKYDKKWVPGRWESRCVSPSCYGYYDYGYYNYGYSYRSPWQDYRSSGMPSTVPDTGRGGSIPYGYFDSNGVWVPYRQ